MQKLLFGAAITTILTAGFTGHAYAQAATTGLEQYEDDSYVVISGNVQKVDEDSLTINHEGNDINVEFEQWGWANETNLRNYLKAGDQVVVSGEVDKNWFTEDKIEANNIYFRDNYDYYYVVDTNPAYYSAFNGMGNMEDGSYMSVRGEVSKINEDGMIINTQNTKIQVDTSELTSTTNKENRTRNIKVGDRVYVYGEVDNNFFEKKELVADGLVKLNQINRNNQQTSMKN